MFPDSAELVTLLTAPHPNESWLTSPWRPQTAAMFVVRAAVGSWVTGGDPNVRVAAGMFGGVETTAPPDMPHGAAATPHRRAPHRWCPDPSPGCQSNSVSQPSDAELLLNRCCIATFAERYCMATTSAIARTSSAPNCCVPIMTCRLSKPSTDIANNSAAAVLGGAPAAARPSRTNCTNAAS